MSDRDRRMSFVDRAFEQLDRTPNLETLESVTTQIESLSKMLSRDEMKVALMGNIRRILKEEKFEQVRQDDTTLRLYKILIQYSDNLKGTGIFKQLRRKGFYINSLKFYVLWAEECGKEKSINEFKKVLNLARDALSPQIAMTDIEAGFRDLVDEYFNGEAGDIFSSPDDNAANTIAGKKKKRRSSVCFLQNTAPKSSAEAPAFGLKTRTNIRREFIDFDGAYGVSIEEYRYAQWKDNFSEDVDNNLKKEHLIMPSAERKSRGENKTEGENKMQGKLNPRRRHLSPLNEGNDDDEEEKRSRLYSPLVPTKDAQRPPLRNSMLNKDNISTIVLSSDTKSVSAKDASYVEPNDSINENEKLKLMSAGRASRYSTNSLSSSLQTAKSGGGLDLMSENNQLEAHAMFSDTVHLDNSLPKTSHLVPNISITGATPRPQSTTTDYSVFCDPDPTMTLIAPPQEELQKKSSGLNVVYDEQAEEDKKEEENGSATDEETLKVKEEEDDIRLPKKSLITPPTLDNLEMFHEEEDFLSGLNKPSRGMIVTSTPAHNVPFVNIDDYFGNKQEAAAAAAAVETQPKFLVPTSSTLNKMMRRKSQAASARSPPSVPPPPQPEPSKSAVANSTIDGLTDNLGRRLSIGADEIQKIVVDEAEITGCKNRRRSEIIKKGDINPWDEALRTKLMKLVRPPMNMHEFPERAPKLQALRDCEVGGEVFHIQTLIGQGGYAKVYRAVTEEKETVAVKYEVPSCSWEVYICDQMRTRLLKDRNCEKMADMCIMQVMDAYVFSTASLLVNEYHEFGTLLEYANNMKDPNWHITCFLVTQIARIMKEIHACKIIHGDVKPDNFMITRKIDANWGKDALMSNDSFVIKLIDWGRAIDMMPLKGHTFKGRAGTEGFDSPEMIDGRPWNFQADYYGFAATIAVVVNGKYAELIGDQVGSYELNMDIKRRNILRDTITGITEAFLNIPSCEELPDWNVTIQALEAFWNENFDVSAWRQAVAKFNEACDTAAAVHK